MNLYIRSPIRLHSVVLNYLSTGQLYSTRLGLVELSQAKLD
jgi:hypothetical protein